jgi:carbonic anhydrase
MMRSHIYPVISLFACILLLLLCIACNKPAANTSLPKSVVLANLIKGNQRFYNSHLLHPHESMQRIHDLADHQNPTAVIVCCSDSRTSPELVFDQGLGDLFVIRNAGNIIGDIDLGTIEYAVQHFHVPLIIIMGHRNCGAIKAYLEHGEAPGHIMYIIDSLRNEPEIAELAAKDISESDYYIMANVRHAIARIKSQSPLIADHLQNGTVTIVGAIYDVNNGIVKLIN